MMNAPQSFDPFCTCTSIILHFNHFALDLAPTVSCPALFVFCPKVIGVCIHCLFVQLLRVNHTH